MARRNQDRVLSVREVIGAAGGTLAAVPDPDTLVNLIGGTIVEIGVLLRRATYMIMDVAGAYGLGLDEIEVRRYAVLRVVVQGRSADIVDRTKLNVPAAFRRVPARRRR